jgi:hypothetical protein
MDMDMDINFTKTTPELIDHKALKKIQKFFTNKAQENAIPSKIKYFYDSYIEPNMFLLFSICVFFVYLGIKYYMKHYINKKIDDDDDDIQYEKLYQPPTMIDELPNFAEELEESIFDENDDQLSRLHEEVNNARKEGIMSEYMIQDMYNQKYNKIRFNEMTRLQAGGGY